MRKTVIWAALVVAQGRSHSRRTAPRRLRRRGPGTGWGRPDGHPGAGAKGPRDADPEGKVEQYLKDMDAKKQQTLRMIEGGKSNVNIRRITNAETALVHPNTIDVWVVLDGGGTLTTGGKIENGKIVGGHVARVQGGRRGVHPVRPAPRRQRRAGQHHLAQRPLGRRLWSRAGYSAA